MAFRNAYFRIKKMKWNETKHIQIIFLMHMGWHCVSGFHAAMLPLLLMLLLAVAYEHEKVPCVCVAQTMMMMIVNSSPSTLRSITQSKTCHFCCHSIFFGMLIENSFKNIRFQWSFKLFFSLCFSSCTSFFLETTRITSIFRAEKKWKLEKQ